MKTNSLFTLILVLLIAIACVTRARAETRLSAVLSGAKDIPPNISDANGRAVFFLNGNMLEYAIGVDFNFAWQGMINGPGSSDESAPIIFSLAPDGCFTPSATDPGSCVWFGFSTLTTVQLQQILAGQWYFRASDGTSSVRGQILLDDDLDGVPDGQDECPGTPFCPDRCGALLRGGYVDSAGCSVAQLPQLCPCQGPWRGHGEYVKCVKEAVRRFEAEGFMTPEAARGLETRAVKSNCGKK